MAQKYFYEPDDNSTHLYRHLETTGDGTGSKDANVDGSSTPVDFLIQPPAGEVYVLNRLLIYIEDTGNFRAGHYGVLGGALSNGVTLKVTDSSDVEILDLTANDPVTTNGGWGENSYDVDVKAWGSGNEILLARWTFAASGRPLILKDQQKFKITINDNLTGLVKHHFHVQGYKGYGKAGNA